MKNGYTTFYIIRHGQTEWNVRGLMQGQKDSILTMVGEEQAMNVAEELKAIEFDAAYSSDLVRAKRTAEIIALDDKLAVQTSKLLRERAFGQLEGKPYEAIRTHEQFYLALSDQDKLSYRVDENSESDEEVVFRLIRFIRETAVIYPGKTILVVSHGDIMHKFLIHLGFAKHTNLPVWGLGNTCYIKLETDGVDFFVKETKRITFHENWMNADSAG